MDHRELREMEDALGRVANAVKAKLDIYAIGMASKERDDRSTSARKAHELISKLKNVFGDRTAQLLHMYFSQTADEIRYDVYGEE